MVRTPHPNPGDAGFARDLDSQVGRIGHHQVAHPVVAIDERGGRRALDHTDIRARIDVSALECPHIARKTKDAVRVGA